MEYTLKPFVKIEDKETELLFFCGNTVPSFIIQWLEIQDHKVNFLIYEVTHWFGNNPAVYDEYLSATINWDGESHFGFGDDGYIQIDGKHEFDMHCNLMQAIWEISTKRIKLFNPEIGG